MSLTIPYSEEQQKLDELVAFLSALTDQSTPEPNKIFKKVCVGDFSMFETIGNDEIPYCLILPTTVIYPEGMPYVGTFGIQLLMMFSENEHTDAEVEHLRSYILTSIVTARNSGISPYWFKSSQRGEVVVIRGLATVVEKPYMALSFEIETVVRSLKT